jgi:aryl carrier-like protein
VLGVFGVGIADNFFELGGDSIVSIQLVSRARKAGLVITPRAVFQYQTVEALAAIAAFVEKRASTLPDIATGALPLTPIMHWLLERGGPIDHFNQAMLLQVPAGVYEDHLIAALQAVLDHHDALRLPTSLLRFCLPGWSRRGTAFDASMFVASTMRRGVAALRNRCRRLQRGLLRRAE